MNFSMFQSNGHARKLKSLAADLLGKKIQVHRHSAKEDAMAAMQLYLKYITVIEQDPDILLSHHLGLLTAAIDSRSQETS
ncbi:hypothetical protein COCOBI_08-5400 [Coccomyxa sp. Obi]|nr:hypothetical protein COCOBI_08-5400 [Coccomyxa sp. Obi]